MHENPPLVNTKLQIVTSTRLQTFFFKRFSPASKGFFGHRNLRIFRATLPLRIPNRKDIAPERPTDLSLQA